MWNKPLKLRRPGLFITGTDTEVGKTVISCAIAAVLRRQQPGVRLGVCKPFGSGCRKDREGLVSEDAEALAHFADCRAHLDLINPVRFAAPLAPAVAAEQNSTAINWPEVRRSLTVLDQSSDAMLVEGVGGLLVPLDPANPRLTVLDLAVAIGYPVLVVARSGLGTLNHTAMTVRLLKGAGCRVGGLVMNYYEPDVAKSPDSSLNSNRIWLSKMTGVKVLAVVPAVKDEPPAVHKAKMPAAVLDTVATTFWPDVLDAPP